MIRSLFLFALVSLSASNMIGCNNTNSDELAKVKAEAEAARAEVAKLKAAAVPVAPVVKAKTKVTGEIYATTNGGDIKKGAGLSVYFIPVTQATRELIADAIGQIDAIRVFEEGYQVQQKERYPLKDQYSFPAFSPLDNETNVSMILFFISSAALLVKVIAKMAL